MSGAAPEAQARPQAYALLGALLMEGLDEERLAVVRGLPPLAEGLGAQVDLDALAAEHYALFGHELFPFEGVFTSDTGLVGAGVAATMVRAAHAALGLACEDDPSLDHLGQGLRIMGILAEAEQQARAHGEPGDARALEGWQRRVLDEALLPWMPPLYVALMGQPRGVWTRVLELAIGVLARHRAELPGLPQAGAPTADTADVEAVLDDPRTGLLTVAEVLVTPARCGVYLARRDIDRVARRCELPPGFGSRQDMLERLLRMAAEYQLLPRALDELLRVMDARDEAYGGLEREPGLGPYVPAWRRRVQGSRRMLERLREAAMAGA